MYETTKIKTDASIEFDWITNFPAFMKSVDSSRLGALAGRGKVAQWHQVAHWHHLGILTFSNLLSQTKNLQKQNYISYSSYSLILIN